MFNKADLQTMDDITLMENGLAYENIPYTAQYRQEVKDRQNRGVWNPRQLQLITYNKRMPPDVRPLSEELRKEPSTGVKRFAEAILYSGWDFIDPLKSKGMVKTPEEIAEFLEDLIFTDKPWNEIHERGQNLLNTIRDAYYRWYRTQIEIERK